MDIEVSEEAGVRYLHFGSDWVQGAMRIAHVVATSTSKYAQQIRAGRHRLSADEPRSSGGADRNSTSSNPSRAARST